MTKQCPTCSKVNPASATYCYYDGRALTTVSQVEPRRPGTLPFLTPFSFPNGQNCGNFDQLALACDLHWNDARAFLVNGIWCSFFSKIGRHDLAATAVQAAKEADRDVGLAYLLERLPTDALRRPTLSLLAETEDLGTLKPGTDHKFELVIVNKGGLVLAGTVVSGCEWFFFGDRHGNESRKLFQTRDHYTLFVRVLGEKLCASRTPLEGQIAIMTNGGTMTVAVKATVPILPFPNGEYLENVLAGARSPREVALKAKAHPREAAPFFEQGAVKAWYTSNGWTYPVQGTQGKGKAGVQQFFEALGLSKPPHLEISTERIDCQGEVGQQLTTTVTVSTKETKFVNAEAQSDQAWIKVQPSSAKGTRVKIPLLIEVPSCPGESLHARLTVQGNGRQRFIVPVTLTVEGMTAAEAEAEKQASDRSRRRLWVFAGVGGALVLFLALGLVALFGKHREPAPPLPLPGEDNQQQQATKSEAWWDEVPDQKLAASAVELNANAPADCQVILERLRVKADTDRFTAYEQLAAKLPELVRNEKTRKPLARFLTECCVREPSDLNIAPLQRALAELFPREGARFNPREKGRELEDALYARQILFNAMAHKAIKPEQARSLANEFGTVFGFAIDTSAPLEELAVETEKLLAVRCYRNTLPTARKSVEHALTIRAVLIEKFPQHLPQTLRNQIDAEVLVIGLGKGGAALWPQMEPIVKTCLASGDANIGRKLVDVYTNANADLAGKMVVLLAPKWKEAAHAKLTPAERVAALHKFLNITDPNKTSRVPAFRLLLNPIGDADEEASLGVLKTLLDESNSLTSEEMDVLIEALRDVKRRTKVRCFAADNLGEGEQAERAVPALVDVLREKSDVKLRSLSIKALGHIGDKRKDVLTLLLTLALSAAEEEIRLESLQLLEQLEPSALSSAQIIKRWSAEKSSSVRQALGKLLQSRLALLEPEQMKELLPLLRHKDADLVVVGLKVVEAKKKAAADVAAEVADLLEHKKANVREASLEALQALGTAASKARPNLTQLLLDHSVMEKDVAVRQALGKLLQSRLALLEPEQMKELLPLLRHKDADLVVVGLKVVEAKKKAAADVAAEVADLLKHGEAEVREAALKALQALGSSGRKALPKLFEVLKQAPKHQRTLLALTAADIVDAKGAESVARLVPFLLEGLHPQSIRILGRDPEAAINRALLKIGQPAVEGAFTVLNANLQLEIAGLDNIDYRRNLYNALAKLGPSCQSQANFESLQRLRNKEIGKKFNDTIVAARIALAAMDPK